MVYKPNMPAYHHYVDIIPEPYFRSQIPLLPKNQQEHSVPFEPYMAKISCCHSIVKLGLISIFLLFFCNAQPISDVNSSANESCIERDITALITCSMHHLRKLAKPKMERI